MPGLDLYMVMSYDFGGESNVDIDAITSNVDDAQRKYEELVAQHYEYNLRDDGCRYIVNLVQVIVIKVFHYFFIIIQIFQDIADYLQQTIFNESVTHCWAGSH